MGGVGDRGRGGLRARVLGRILALARELLGAPGRTHAQALVLVWGLAVAVRAWILLTPGLGFAGDLAYFTSWMRALGANGLAGFYGPETFCDYPPLMILGMRVLGGVVPVLSHAATDHAYHVAIKTFACLADLAIGMVLYRECRHLLGRTAAAVASALYLLNPVAIYDSAYWGQVDAVYAAFMLGAVVCVRQRRWASAGVASALGVAAKFQTIAVLPLVVFEAYRLGGMRAIARTSAGTLVAVMVVAAPFLATGTFGEVTRRAYVDVIGQYHARSLNAFNVWQLIGDPDASDTSPPRALIAVAANGDVAVDREASWILGWTWRRISLVLFALGVAAVISLYARRPGDVSRYGAAGLLVLCFFLLPTEMHERYLFPAIALLAPWAAAHRVHERLYWALTVASLLNFTAVLSPAPLGPQIAFAMLLAFCAVLVMTTAARTGAHAPEDRRPRATGGEDDAITPRRRAVIRAFQRTTAAACAAAVLVAFVVPVIVWALPERLPERSLWLSEMTPERAQQEWGHLRRDRAVSGAPLEIDGTFFLRGLGTHAPATLVYAIPPDARTFAAVIGVDRAGGEGGSVTVTIEVDGEPAYRSPVLTARDDAEVVRIDVAGAERLTIEVDETPDGGRSDHVDLALARFVIGDR